MNKQCEGKIGEDIACKYFKKNGYQIIARNFRSQFGEIDIVAQNDKKIVFVEVKTRSSANYGEPQLAVTRHKLTTIIKTAHYYLLLNPNLSKNIQVDVVAIKLNQGGQFLELRHFENVYF